MATFLGKRRRTIHDADPTELPVKRSRRSAREAATEANGQAEDLVIFEDGNKENETGTQQTACDDLGTREECSAKTVPKTPSASRYHDALGSAPKTPSSRHRVMSAGKLFKRTTPSGLPTPATPGTVKTVYQQARRLFARNADPGRLVGREEERRQLTDFVSRLGGPNSRGCLYVSGPPGTGKSAMVNEVTAEATRSVPEGVTVRQAYINCMSIKSTSDLHKSLLGLLGRDDDVSEKDAILMLQAMFVPKKKTREAYLVVLDEVDHIVTLDIESLYRLFEWSLQKSSCLLLVGIANALDLTDRFLPRLKARNLKPELLPFLPYNAAQVKTIITSRLRDVMHKEDPSSDFVPFMHPAAIELCSRKVSSQTGDLRLAFEICRRAIDMVELETREKLEDEAREKQLLSTPSRKPLGEKTSVNASPSSPLRGDGKVARGTTAAAADEALAAALQALTAATAPRATIAHVNRVTSAAFGNGTAQRLRALNLQQKVALCTLLAMEQRSRSMAAAAAATTTDESPTKASASTQSATPRRRNASGVCAGARPTAPTVRELYAAYTLLCTSSGASAGGSDSNGTGGVLHPLSASEFREVLGNLDAMGLVADATTGATAAATATASGMTTPRSGRGGGKTARTTGGLFAGGAARTAGAAGDDRRISCRVSEAEMRSVLDGYGGDILRSILSGEALD